MWYLSAYSDRGANNTRVFSVCLDELISQAVSQSADATASPSTPWQTLTVTPLTQCSVLILNGALLTVGGFCSSAIHLYQPSSRSWVKVDGFSTVRWECACIVLSSGQIFVVGGRNSSNFNFDNTLDVGIIQ